MNSTPRLLFALACCGASGLTVAQGAGLGADSAVADAGDCEVETSFERKKVRGEPGERESALRLACGIGWRTELEARLARMRAGDASGRGLSLEAKTSLRDREGDRIGWALAAGIDAERLIGGRWHRSGERVELEASRQFGSAWLLEGKLGTARERAGRRHSTTWALSVEQAWSERVELKAELGGDDRSKPLVGLSWRYALWRDDVQLKASWSMRTGTPHEQRGAVSLQVGF